MRGRTHLRGRPAIACAAPIWLILLTACGSDESGEEVPTVIDPASVPVPAADGPKLLVTRPNVPVRERPAAGGKPLGTLRLGATVARSDAPVSTAECAGGWYAVRPRGFVCAGDEATIELDHPAVRLSAPALERPLPYRYATVRKGAAVSYGSLPSAAEQAEAEPGLRIQKAPRDERLGAGANDVPVDENARPTGPPVVMPEGDGVGSDGYRSRASFFAPLGLAAVAPGTSFLGRDPAATETRVLKSGSGVGLASLFDHEGRAFAVSAEGRFIPVDNLLPVLGATWHGADAAKRDLPLGFALRSGVLLYDLDEKAIARDEELEVHEAVALNGKFRTVAGERYFSTTSGAWVRHRDIILVPKRDKFPDFASGDQKWIDISLANQTLVAWEGKKPVLATLISSGQDRLGDPNQGPSTLQGVFKLRKKAITAEVDSREVQQTHSLSDVPWVMEFAEGFSLVGCYWHSRFGESVGFHDVALSPIDARFLFQWTSPAVPEGWHSLEIAEDEGTIVYVHK